jgi:hypothetical protein
VKLWAAYKMANLLQDPIIDLCSIFYEQNTKPESRTVLWASECHTYGEHEAVEIVIYLTKNLPDDESKRNQDSIIISLKNKRSRGLNISSITTLTDGVAVRIKVNFIRTKLSDLPSDTEIYREEKVETNYKYNPLVPYGEDQVVDPLNNFLGSVPSAEDNQLIAFLTSQNTPVTETPRDDGEFFDMIRELELDQDFTHPDLK